MKRMQYLNWSPDATTKEPADILLSAHDVNRQLLSNPLGLHQWYTIKIIRLPPKHKNRPNTRLRYVKDDMWKFTAPVYLKYRDRHSEIFTLHTRWGMFCEIVLVHMIPIIGYRAASLKNSQQNRIFFMGYAVNYLTTQINRAAIQSLKCIYYIHVIMILKWFWLLTFWIFNYRSPV